jgi:hypothetical protein
MARTIAKWASGVTAGVAVLLALLVSPFALNQVATATSID